MPHLRDLALAAFALLYTVFASSVTTTNAKNVYEYVAVFSIDGLHASDIDKYLAVRPNSTIATLLETAYLYPNANTSAPSDSFPGTMAQFTGGSPRTTGVWYDVIWDRSYYPPGSNCTGPLGVEITDDDSIDYNSSLIFSGGINPDLLSEYLVDGVCQKLYPHNRLRVNTVFEVVRSRGCETAYADKHPAYDIVRGPSGTGLTTGYFPEIAATAGTVASTIAWDELHVQAWLDWLDAKTPANSEGTLTAVPKLFGGNFQAFNVAEINVGYLNETGNPFSPALLRALDSIDTQLGRVVEKLKAKGMYDDTLMIIASKHGQSAINSELFNTVDPQAVVNATGVDIVYQIADDIIFLFLENTYDTQTAVTNLNANLESLKISQLYSNAPHGSLSLLHNGFGTTLADPAVPDIIVIPELGTIYTPSYGGLEDHGGFNNDDRNIACFVSNSRLERKVFDENVSTQQIAPLILKALGIEPHELEAVVAENVHMLPGF